jgi:malate dehydrogenase
MFTRSLTKAAKVTILGAAGGIGQPLSLLVKQSPLVSELALHDIVGSVGVAADIAHISSPAKTTGYVKDDIKLALDGADVVIIPAGVPRKPGMTRDDLFNTNASIVKSLALECGKVCPKACILVISNPVNSTVPIAAEALKSVNAFDPAKLFGVTTLDIVRAKTFVAGNKGLNPFDISINVVGGHSGPTIVPLLSQTGLNFSAEEIKALTQRIQFGGDEVVKAKDGAGSATLSMAYAGAEFAFTLLKALRGDKGLSECTFVQSNEVKGLDFFSTRVELGKNGVEATRAIGAMSDFELELLEKCKIELAANIKKGVEFGQK